MRATVKEVLKNFQKEYPNYPIRIFSNKDKEYIPRYLWVNLYNKEVSWTFDDVELSGEPLLIVID